MRLIMTAMAVCFPFWTQASWTTQSDARFGDRTFTYTKEPIDVLIVHDPLFNKSHLAMAVGVGSLQDGEHLGLAHLTEHLLFLGNQTYPEPNDLSQWLSQHEGYANAYTANDTTNYFLEVQHDALQDTLPHFFAMFSPLLEQQAIENAIDIVDLEHQKNQNQPNWMLSYQTRSSLFPNHPRGLFHTGDSQTLKDVTPAIVTNFFRDFYALKSMHLVVLTNQPTNQVQAWLKPYLHTLSESLNSVAKTTPRALPTPPHHEHTSMLVDQPIIGQLSVTWQTPYDAQYYQTRHLLHGLLTQDGEGTLVRSLKNLDLIQNLYYLNNTPHLGVQQHQIIMSLTSLGEQEIPTIKAITQSYFDFLINNPIPDDFIKLMQMAKQQAFHLEEAHDLEEKVTDLSQHLRQGRSIDQWLSSQYSQDGIESFNQQLKNPIKPTYVSQLYPSSNTYYAYQSTKTKAHTQESSTFNYPKNPFVNKGYQPNTIDHLTINKNIYDNNILLNDYLNENNLAKPSVLTRSIDPQALASLKSFHTFKPYDQGAQWLHYVGPTWLSHQHSVMIHWQSSEKNDITHAVYDDLIAQWLKMHSEILTDQISYLNYTISINGQELAITGPYNHLSMILEHALNVYETLDEKALKRDFPKIKERLSKQYKQPKNLTDNVLSYYAALRNDRHHTDALRLNCLEDFTVQDMAKIVNYFNKKTPKTLIFSDAEANDIKDVLYHKLSHGNYPVKSLGIYEYSEQTEFGIVPNEPQHAMLSWRSHAPSTTINYQDIYTNEIIGMALKAPYYKTLRTQQGLGYIVFLSASRFPYSPSLIGYLQGDQDPQTFKLKEAAFFESICQSLPDITPYHNALINRLKTPKTNRSSILSPYITRAFDPLMSLSLNEYYQIIKAQPASDFHKNFKAWCHDHQTHYILTSHNNAQPQYERRKVIVSKPSSANPKTE